MNPRVTIGFLVVLALLGAGVYFTSPPPSATPPAGAGAPGAPPPAPEATPDPSLQMYTFDDQQIVKIEFFKAGNVTTVTKNGDDWLVQPAGVVADRFRVNSLLVRLASLKANRRLANPAEAPAVFGLETPDMLVRLWRQDDSLYEMIVGGKTPNDAGTYAKRPDDTSVFVVPNTLVSDIEKMVTDPPIAPPTPTPRPTDVVTPTPLVPDPTLTP
jgi:hypothetical protein